ncbi:hypothetical protein PBR31_00057 [Xanthomonas phage PBR31]|uniref:Uncharacterized protein n=1 Tax=Xanthomonas phage PPDBI TaxID=2723911 RepID=A0A6H0X5S4_9CAUD|nr:hypothetical protein [Ralstonia pickettii]NYS09355.1 hypothetical protein [Ralstonia pickettii]QIN95368.1 hypothetical protein PBR31_00057 [Xanthomonas phage PBR31]QIW89416.1 hypothetical protein PPDBI_00057 [Xanthomonas phage PPDBI]
MEEVDTRHLVVQAAGQCMAPDQYASIEALAENDPSVYDRFLRCIEDRTPLEEVIGALRLLTMGRHMSYPIEFGGYVCRHCGGYTTDPQHFRVGEDAKTDMEKAKAVLAKALGA